jgi:hypothetical protein
MVTQRSQHFYLTKAVLERLASLLGVLEPKSHGLLVQNLHGDFCLSGAPAHGDGRGYVNPALSTRTEDLT